TLVEALALFEAGAIEEIAQDDARATFAPRLGRADAHVDWTAEAIDVSRRIRGLDSVPGAWSRLGDDELKLYRPLPVEHVHRQTPGTVLDITTGDAPHGFLVACGNNAVWIREVKPAGKRRMTSAEWLRGHGIETGVVLS